MSYLNFGMKPGNQYAMQKANKKDTKQPARQPDDFLDSKVCFKLILNLCLG